jgi:hypothetical protein
VDSVYFNSAYTGLIEGRLPNGATNITRLALATPGAGNEWGVDTDRDGLPDLWETAFGLNPNDPQDANLDTDGDGLSNLDEYLSGTNPTSAQSGLDLSLSNLGQGAFELSFEAMPGKTYTIWGRDAWGAGDWFRFRDLSPVAVKSVTKITDLPPAGKTQRYYQLMVNP